MRFVTRPFELPEELIADLRALSSLTPEEKRALKRSPVSEVLEQHKGRHGDYGLARAWYTNLSKQFNWAGNTMGFQFVWNHFQKENFEENPFFRQLMVEDACGNPIGYVRFTHLQTDRDPDMVVRSKTTGEPISFVTRRGDCTKIEETTYADTKWLGDPSLARFMFGAVVKDAAKMGKARVVTELATGFSGPKFNSLARQITALHKNDVPDDDPELNRLRNLFVKDWVDVTRRFAQDTSFTPIDTIVPENPDSGETCQIRIHHVVDGATPLPLPDYKAVGRICTAVKDEGDFDHIREAIDNLRSRACDKYGLNPQSLALA